MVTMKRKIMLNNMQEIKLESDKKRFKLNNNDNMYHDSITETSSELFPDIIRNISKFSDNNTKKNQRILNKDWYENTNFEIIINSKERLEDFCNSGYNIKNITSIKIILKDISKADMSKFVAAIKDNHNIKELFISTEDIPEIILHNSEKLSTLAEDIPKSILYSLKNLKNLKKLSISTFDISESVLNDLCKINNLTELSLENFIIHNKNRVEHCGPRKLTNLGPIISMQNLEKLSLINCNGLFSISGLKELKKLKELILTGYSQLETVEGLPSNLKKLTIGNINKLKCGLNEFINFTELKKLHIINCDEKPTAAVTNLRNVKVTYSKSLDNKSNIIEKLKTPVIKNTSSKRSLVF